MAGGLGADIGVVLDQQDTSAMGVNKGLRIDGLPGGRSLSTGRASLPSRCLVLACLASGGKAVGQIM